MAADIVIFDAATVKDNSTFEFPHQYSTGFQFVLVNGQVVVEDGKHNFTRSGRSLKGPGYQLQMNQ
jgi:N-acyl-D-amino-acid deacylase